MSIHLASIKMQSDLAGLTGPNVRPPAAAPPSPTDIFSTIHGESGSLHYLWDSVATPVMDTLRPPDQAGPSGGAAHPGTILGHLRALGPTISGAFTPVAYPVVGPREQQNTAPTPPVGVGAVFDATEASPV